MWSFRFGLGRSVDRHTPPPPTRAVVIRAIDRMLMDLGLSGDSAVVRPAVFLAGMASENVSGSDVTVDGGLIQTL